VIRSQPGLATPAAANRKIAMTTMQKIFFAASLAAAIGIGCYEARRAAQLQAQAQTLRQQQDTLANQLQQERDETAKALAAARQRNEGSTGDLTELLKLRARVAKLQDDARELARLKAVSAKENDSPTSEMKGWLERVSRLKEKLGQMPDQKIPELQFLTEVDWLDAVRKVKQLETEADFSQALSALRISAKDEFAHMLQNALASYAQANNGQSPVDWSQLQSYFASPIDDSLLQRYELTQTGAVTEKATPLDDQDDVYYQVNASGVSITGGAVAENTLQPALEAFAAANNGLKPSNPSQLLPYVTTPAQQAVLQRLIQNPSAR
jgi:outer membrane murein-binding lipoprotein Lpp